MALNLMLRRATSTVLPLGIRTVASPRTFRSLASPRIFQATVLNVDRASISRSRIGSFLQFSSKPAADESLIRVLQSEIECADEPTELHTPNEFPFEIQDNPGQQTILLTRRYQDEDIKVEVDIPNVDAAEDEDDDGNDNDEEANDRSSIPLVVSISKGRGITGMCLEFGVTAFPDEITIDTLSIKQPDASEDQLAYEGPDFSDLDENLQKAFHKYLEVRGIKPSTTNFLHEYMINKDSREYLHWLNNLKKFVAK